MLPDYYIYVNGFWGGFVEKTDANHIDFFEKVLAKTKLSNYTITSDLKEANVLFESVFSKSLVDTKKWTYKIHYSGEPYSNDSNTYDLVLCSQNTAGNVVDVPLFVYYIHGNNFMNQLLSKPVITKVPQHFCCFIVSNSKGMVRNRMFALLNSYKKVHSYGKFANNMGHLLPFDYWTEDFRQLLSSYKFIICFENSKLGTYSTEKIINPYLSGTIPIYWSSHHIKNIFNSDSMLFLEDETDASYQHVFDMVKELDTLDEKYLEFVNRPTFNACDYWDEHYTVEKIAQNIDTVLSRHCRDSHDVSQ